MEKFKRTELLIGENNIKTLQKCNVLVVGVGGVGGYIAEFLVRSGIGNITIVDFDTISESNINRQIIATEKNVGLSKVVEMKKRLLEINSNLNIYVVDAKFTTENAQQILTLNKFDFVVDAIDIIENKVELICIAKELKLNIISALGAGNRFEIPSFKITDIYKTNNDGLARVLRKKLREKNVDSLDVCVCENVPVKTLNTENSSNERQIGSIVYYPAMSACLISAFVVNKLICFDKK